MPLRLLHPDHRCASTGAGHTCEWSAKIWLNTRELLKRKNIELQDCACVLYNDNSGEILLHLFFECSHLVNGVGDLSMSDGIHLYLHMIC
jgi:hypothetical protein